MRRWRLSRPVAGNGFGRVLGGERERWSRSWRGGRSRRGLGAQALSVMPPHFGQRGRRGFASSGRPFSLAGMLLGWCSGCDLGLRGGLRPRCGRGCDLGLRDGLRPRRGRGSGSARRSGCRFGRRFHRRDHSRGGGWGRVVGCDGLRAIGRDHEQGKGKDEHPNRCHSRYTAQRLVSTSAHLHAVRTRMLRDSRLDNARSAGAHASAGCKSSKERIRSSTSSITESGVDAPAVMPTRPACWNQAGSSSDGRST